MDGAALQSLIIPVGFLVVFYFFIVRPQKKKEQEINSMRTSLEVGDKIITIGGIHGKIAVIKEDMIIVEVGSSKTRLELAKWAVGSKVE